MYRIFALALTITMFGGAFLIAGARPTQRSVDMEPGDSLVVTCNGAFVSDTYQFDPGYADLDCVESGNTVDPEPTATSTPEPTATAESTATAIVDDPTVTPTHEHGDTMTTWHAPGSHDGLPNHEHGDAPPQWVYDAGYEPGYAHDGGTPNENMLKHTAMKGFAATLKGIDVYVIAHLDTHPNGQQTRFHSYQFWMRDPSGGVSHMQGWMDFGEGNNALPNIRPVDGCGPGSGGLRPIIAVNFDGCDLKFESWYPRAGGFGPDFGFNMQAQYYAGPEVGTLSSGSLDDIDTWIPTGQANDTRRIEIAWYAFRSTVRGEFWADQGGRILSGPDDPSVGTVITVGGKSYTVVALRQYIAPTATTLGFPNNSFQRKYDMAQPYSLPN